VKANCQLVRACATPITDGIQPSEYSSALSLLSLAVNCCDVTLGDMLTFKLVLGGKLRIRKSQLQTQLLSVAKVRDGMPMNADVELEAECQNARFHPVYSRK